MSDLISTPMSGRTVRRGLLLTVSTLALVAPFTVATARAGSAAVWIELGGQLERAATEEPYSPPFLLKEPLPAFEDPIPLEAERAPRYSYGTEGKISFRPRQSDWVFSAAIRYGRSSNNKRVHQSGDSIQYGTIVNLSPAQFADTRALHEESHTVLDFQVGKDVGLGIWGKNSQSVVSGGVRFAQFSSKSDVSISSDPDLILHYKQVGARNIPFKYHHTYTGSAAAKRNFHGMGPSLSWSNSVSAFEIGEDSNVAIDFGLNGSILFGRQKIEEHHQTKAQYYNQKYFFRGKNPHLPLYTHSPLPQTRTRSVVVPNIGGFAGISMRYSRAKVSLGYRGEIFFNAMDDGFDTAKSADRTFHGPFATISIGLGG